MSFVCPAILGLIPGSWRRNLAAASIAFDSASWTKTATTVTADQVAAPDGTTTADKIANTATNNTFVTQSTTIATGDAVIVSVYAQYASQSAPFVALFVSDGVSNGERHYFNVQTGALGSAQSIGTGWTVADKGIISGANGWYRVWMKIVTAGTTALNFGVHPALNADNATTCTSGRFNYIWGYQLQKSQVLTSFILT